MNLKSKKILVTGADGFIGSHLVEKLVDEGYKVRAFVYYNSFNHWGWLDTFPAEKLKKIEVFPGDIRDSHRVHTAVRDADVIFHLAALVAIPYSYHSPESYADTNVRGTLNVLQAAKEYGTQKVLITSTSEVYGTAQYTPVDEVHPRQGQSPYAATKIGADALAESFWRSYGLPVTIVRPFNTFGPRQSARAVIPAIITQLLSGNSRIQLGSLHPTRDLVFVQDTVNAFLEIARSDKTTGEEINIATQCEISVGDLAHKIAHLMKVNARFVTDARRVRPARSEVDRLCGNHGKLLRLTTWKPQFTLDQGLKQTIAWFRKKENLSRYKSDIYNV